MSLLAVIESRRRGCTAGRPYPLVESESEQTTTGSVVLFPLVLLLFFSFCSDFFGSKESEVLGWFSVIRTSRGESVCNGGGIGWQEKKTNGLADGREEDGGEDRDSFRLQVLLYMVRCRTRQWGGRERERGKRRMSGV